MIVRKYDYTSGKVETQNKQGPGVTGTILKFTDILQHRLYKVKTGHLAACGCPVGGTEAVKGLMMVWWGIRRKA